MNDKEIIFPRAVVLATHRGDMYTIEATLGSLRRTIRARRAGGLVSKRINILIGDIVDVAVSPYDLSCGRIIFRHK